MQNPGIVAGTGTLTINYAYGGYFYTPTIATNNFALYTDNLSVGSAVVPPANGIYSKGHVVLASGGYLAVNGGTPSINIGVTNDLACTAGVASIGPCSYSCYQNDYTGINFPNGGEVDMVCNNTNVLQATSTTINFSVNPSGNIASGTYTPALSNYVNFASGDVLTNGGASYTRIGSIVTVQGTLLILTSTIANYFRCKYNMTF